MYLNMVKYGKIFYNFYCWYDGLREKEREYMW